MKLQKLKIHISEREAMEVPPLSNELLEAVYFVGREILFLMAVDTCTLSIFQDMTHVLMTSTNFTQ